MHLNKKTRGAISVFLVMILVPCIVVTSIFVDLGRVHMSKSMAYSSADLALDSLLTNYDADLNEWYGMVVSCQSIDEFYEVSAQFFLRTLSSQGLSDDEILLLSAYYADATNDDTIYDLLQVECQTAPSDMIKAVDDANLTNPTLIKEQIVEFMKYRGPIEITLGIIERLKNDSSVSGASESAANKELVDDKTDFYEAEGELLATAYNTYITIRSFQDKNVTNAQLQNYAEKLSVYRNAYSDIHKLLISNLYNTDGLTQYTRIRYRIDKYNSTYTKKHKDVYSRLEENVYYIDGDRITSLLDNLEEEITDFDTAKTNFISASSSLMSKLPGGTSDTNEIQWWVQMNSAVNSSTGVNRTNDLKTASENMLIAYSKVLAIKECELGNEIPEDWETRFDNLVTEVTSRQRQFLITNEEIAELNAAGETVTIDETDSYIKTVKELEKISSDYKSKIISSNLYVTVDGQNKTVDEAILYVNTELTTMRNTLQGYADILNVAINGNESDTSVAKNDKVKSLAAILTLVNKYNSTLGTWTNTANTIGTDLADEDQVEISKINDDFGENITEESVNELKTRLTNILSQIETIIDAIDALEYGNKKVIDIRTFSDLKTAAQTGISASEIKLTNQELLNYAATSFSSLFKPNSNTVLTLEHLSDAKYNPKIDPDTGDVQTPLLYVYFHSYFRNANKDQVDEKQSELDNGKNEGDTAKNNATGKGRYHGGGSNITRDFSGGDTFDLTDGALSALMDLVDGLINLDISNIRDDLYVTAYIMEMFSYATYEEEGLYYLVDDEEKTNLNLPSSGYRPQEYNNYMGDANAENNEGKWLSTDLEDSYNKSLTNIMINKTNNVAYEAEVEYILYGEGNTENVKKVYTNIYVIRYALNLVSGFSNFWGTDNTTGAAINSVANAIQGVTCGVIPAPVTKVVLIPILTIFETSKDLDRLEAGFPVELYKTSHEDWWIKVPEADKNARGVGVLTSAFKRPFDGPNPGKGIYYSDYLTLFVYLGLKGKSSEAMYQRLAEVIQANMRKSTGNKEYSMKKAQLYFKLDAQLRVKPLMITLPYFNEYDNNMDTKLDWCTYDISIIRGY